MCALRNFRRGGRQREAQERKKCDRSHISIIAQVKIAHVGKQAFDQKISALESLRVSPTSPATGEQLRKALKDRSNFLVSKAAALAGEFGLNALIPDLTAAFARFLVDPVKTDPQCWAKNAIVKALKDLDYHEPELFLRGLEHIQLEPVWGGREDTAATLRGACAFALVNCPRPRLEILEYLADRLAMDPAKTVRSDAARAIAQLSGPDSVLLLRFKALCGDRDPEVTGQCLVSLLGMSPRDYIPFIADFLDAADLDVRPEAAAALGECNEPEAVEILKERWPAHTDPDIRRAILLSLGVSRQPSAAEFLCSVLTDGRFEDATHALRALAGSRFRDEYQQRIRASLVQRNETRLTEIFEKEFSR
jgi:HEAT repeat protein